MALRYSVKKGEVLYIEGIRMQFIDNSEILLLDQCDILPERMTIKDPGSLTVLQTFYYVIQETYIKHRSSREGQHGDILRIWHNVKEHLRKTGARRGAEVDVNAIEPLLDQKSYYRLLKMLWKVIDLETPDFWTNNSEHVRQSENYVKSFQPRHVRR